MKCVGLHKLLCQFTLQGKQTKQHKCVTSEHPFFVVKTQVSVQVSLTFESGCQLQI